MHACAHPYLCSFYSLQFSTEEETEAQKINMGAARAGAGVHAPWYDCLSPLLGFFQEPGVHHAEKMSRRPSAVTLGNKRKHFSSSFYSPVLALVLEDT